MNASILVLDGKYAGCRIDLPRTQFVIGRDPRCHLRPASAVVSRLHCAIAACNGRLRACDLRSQNGTYVNDRRISAPTRLRHGDILRIGPLRFRVLLNSVAAVPTRMSESGLGWLVRNPDEIEVAELDPMSRTIIGPAKRAARSGQRVVRQPTAVAGAYLRDYLKRRSGISPT